MTGPRAHRHSLHLAPSTTNAALCPSTAARRRHAARARRFTFHADSRLRGVERHERGARRAVRSHQPEPARAARHTLRRAVAVRVPAVGGASAASGVRTDVTGPAVGDFQELKRIRETPLTPEELNLPKMRCDRCRASLRRAPASAASTAQIYHDPADYFTSLRRASQP